MTIDPITGLTAEKMSEIDRRLAERREVTDAIRTLEQRARRDAGLLMLLKMAADYNTAAGRYAHNGALEVARAINGEAS